MITKSEVLPQRKERLWDLNSFLGDSTLRLYHERYPNLIENKEFLKWIASLRQNSKTTFTKPRVSECISALNRFCKFTGRNPSELLDLAWAWKKEDPRQREANPIVNLLIEFREEKTDVLDGNEASVNASVNMIKSFFSHNEMRVKMKASTNVKPKYKKVEQTKAMVRKHLSAMREIKVKAIKIFTCQSGCSIGDLLGWKEQGKIKKRPLTYGDIKDVLRANKPALIDMKRTKNNTPYYLPITPEVIEIVSAHLEAEMAIHRKPPIDFKTKEPRRTPKPNWVKEDKDPLFANLDGSPYTRFSYDRAAQRAAKLVGLESRDVSAMANRRYFKTTLFDAGMPDPIIEAFLGHKAAGTSGNYNTILSDEAKMLEYWVKYYTNVQLSEVKIIEDADVSELRATVEKQGDMQLHVAVELAKTVKIVSETMKEIQGEIKEIAEKIGAPATAVVLPSLQKLDRVGEMLNKLGRNYLNGWEYLVAEEADPADWDRF